MGEEEYKNINNYIYNGKQKFLDENLGKNDKKKMIDYVTGSEILEVGCGSGVNLNMIEKIFPNSNVKGIDISEKVIETLKLKKQIENRKWEAILGNGLYLNQYVKDQSMDTIIFCSVLHELFSYVEWQGTKFNYDTIRTVLKNAYKALKIGGRIIIRDGIMSEPKDATRKIVFKDEIGLNFLEQYCNDFKGRKISYHLSEKNVAEMNINDAMEFLYTYTWGYDSYKYEINEQYGYFTKTEYIEFIKNLFEDSVNILECSSYLQQGYINNLSKSITLLDENNCIVDLPDSNCLVVIEKIK